MTGHAFLAIDLTDEERHTLAATLGEANSGSPIPGKRAPTEKWHITLRFLGECTDPQADEIMFRLSESDDLEPGRVWCSGLGAFPRVAKAGVVYAGIDDPRGILDHLAGVCDEAAFDAGFEVEHRPFVPHVTLSRLRPALDARTVLDAFSGFRAPIDVKTISLMRNIGSKYTTIDNLRLHRPPP